VRYLGSILKTDEGYKLETTVEAVDATSPFFSASGPENVIVVEVCGQSTPLIIRGAGAGIDVTAERLYEDLCVIKNR
jgi:homoserine dehydrogenase